MPTHGSPDRLLSELWLTWLLPVAAWGGHLVASYALIEWHCQHPEALSTNAAFMGLFVLLGLALVLVSIGLIMAWRMHKRFKRLDGQTSSGRRLFIIRLGMLLGLSATVLILAEAVPLWVLPLCAP